MRALLLFLIAAVLFVQGCDNPGTTSQAPSRDAEKAQTEEQISASTRVAYRIDAKGFLQQDLENCVRNELGAMNDVAPVESGGDWEIRIVGKDSRDFSIYSESLISLSSVVLQPAQEAGLYRVYSHDVTTLQSEKVDKACEAIMEDFAKILEEHGQG